MRFILILFVLVATGCGTLKSTHTDNVKAFAKSAKTLSAAPGELYQDISDYRHQLKLIEVSTIYASDKIVPRLNKIVEVKNQFEQNAAQINQSASLIESYAQCLLALTDAAYEKEWGKQSDELSLQLNTAFDSYNKLFNKKLPSSVGNFIGGVVSQIGSIKLRQLQKRYLKSFVDTGAVIINDVCDYFTTIVALTLDNELNDLDKQFANIMTTFYDNVYDYQKAQNVNPFDYLKYYNPLYLDMKEKLEVLHDLQTKTITSMQRIKTAHQKLQTAVDFNQPSELIAEIKDLYAATNDIKSSLKKLKK